MSVGSPYYSRERVGDAFQVMSAHGSAHRISHAHYHAEPRILPRLSTSIDVRAVDSSAITRRVLARDLPKPGME
jgi:hypothetical protein